jgi:hypothetical protein
LFGLRGAEAFVQFEFYPGSERPGAIWIKPAQSYCMTGIFSRHRSSSGIKNAPFVTEAYFLILRTPANPTRRGEKT